MKPPRASGRRPLATSPFLPPAVKEVPVFSLGDRVTHDTHGLGSVVAIEDGIAITVDFGAGHLRRITSPFARVMLL
jgi:hypothetical protein